MDPAKVRFQKQVERMNKSLKSDEESDLVDHIKKALHAIKTLVQEEKEHVVDDSQDLESSATDQTPNTKVGHEYLSKVIDEASEALQDKIYLDVKKLWEEHKHKIPPEDHEHAFELMYEKNLDEYKSHFVILKCRSWQH